ncbi:thioredoxin family protein [Poritiphilus flavus]|uniref:Thioredoxin family protein n=1 Tax=Poritiphilus flavus TaxID=2697053 RepID=A0A6L9EDI3_9FLAO|nr:thioredoxin family protein [Poritiphilus flavus]NAS12691.1 thioredoxin family protein [Poritiphilus flavus]
MKDQVKETMTKPTEDLIRDSLPGSMSYKEYTSLMDSLARSGNTTGEYTPANENYTLLNDRRIKRWDKKFSVTEDALAKIAAYPREILWLVLTESWCGDAAPTMPVMNKIAEASPNITLRVLLRDENPELMSRFLTNQAMSIPKLIMVDKGSFEVLGSWGPRPSTATKLAADYKAVHGKLSKEFKQDLQMWYNRDKGKDTFKDLMQLLALE